MTIVSTGTDELLDLRRLADDIFGAATEPVLDAQRRDIPFDATLWSTLTASGLTLMTTPESAGGSGGSLRELAVLLERAGYHAAPAPLADTDLLGSWLLQTAGLPIPAGPIAAAVTTTEPKNARLTTTLVSVPWARTAETIVVTGPGFVAALPRAVVTVVERDDIAAQPLDLVEVDADASDGAVFGTVTTDLATQFRLRGALARSVQTCGALTRALEMSSQHVTERIQFGRPLAKFQAVQHLISSAASAVCLATSACDFAIDIADTHGFDSPRTEFAVAVAKVESARAATLVSRNAHQAHGAIGFTLDHRLRHFTTRATAWRSEFGGAREWQYSIGAKLIESGSTAWEFVTSMSARG